MDPSADELIDPFAKILVSSYTSASAAARSFTAEWDYPPTQMLKVHTFRSIIQANVDRSDRYVLHAGYSEAGRVQVTDRDTRESYLIRSRTMVDIDEAKNGDHQLSLFVVTTPRPVAGFPNLLAYKFNRKGMTLWTCPTKYASQDSRRLVPANSPELLGFWPFIDVPAPPPDGGGGGFFDQGAVDPFDDLGDPDIDDLGEAGGL
ncbi:hypothetical protein NIIDNTM18_00300 [Mycolicibacterium litorale]|uniref:Uncharacterized protein n=1 Tax=Mycolicibacterium litorale TaxID=758802 RepID=A0A6S6NYA8_9MYCO|nr:hypothetical protein [Mycolicibacterium litorale]BCI50752.1 hypothetical protein NIIDNTM18_00300 [Mycolicibacterium litorale]